MDDGDDGDKGAVDDDGDAEAVLSQYFKVTAITVIREHAGAEESLEHPGSECLFWEQR